MPVTSDFDQAKAEAFAGKEGNAHVQGQRALHN